METVSLADAKTNLSKIIEQVESGTPVEITRRGKPVARITPVPARRKPIDLAALQALTANMPRQAQGAADLVRTMRDGDRT